MLDIQFHSSKLTDEQQDIVSNGFAIDSKEKNAPDYLKSNLKWLAFNGSKLVAVLTANLLWDWIYIDELWVDRTLQGQGVGKSLLSEVEAYGRNNQVIGLWLWTQSWQAEDFYKKSGFEEFTRFPNFPRGHYRIGLRKELAKH